MKRLIYSILTVAAVGVFSVSCGEKDPVDPDNSVIIVDKVQMNDFDRWLEANFLNPYNIVFKYRYEQNESDLSYWTTPADYNNSIKMAHVVKFLCIESYDEVAGVTFTKKYFPKMFYLIGEWEYKNNGSYILGTAESGKKILLSGIDYFDKYSTTRENLNHYYVKTVHHEFTHILNQNIDYPKSFREVTGDKYVEDDWKDTPDNLINGFITKYARHSHKEDFAELMSVYVTNTAEWWQSQIDAGNADDNTGGDLISTKIDIVKDYMMKNFNIDIDVLRSTILRKQDELFAGEVDLTDLTLN